MKSLNTQNVHGCTDEAPVFGMKAIAQIIGAPERKTYHLAVQGHLKGVFKLGDQWAGLPSVIRANLRAKAEAGIKRKEIA